MCWAGWRACGCCGGSINGSSSVTGLMETRVYSGPGLILSWADCILVAPDAVTFNIWMTLVLAGWLAAIAANADDDTAQVKSGAGVAVAPLFNNWDLNGMMVGYSGNWEGGAGLLLYNTWRDIGFIILLHGGGGVQTESIQFSLEFTLMKIYAGRAFLLLVLQTCPSECFWQLSTSRRRSHCLSVLAASMAKQLIRQTENSGAKFAIVIRLREVWAFVMGAFEFPLPSAAEAGLRR